MTNPSEKPQQYKVKIVKRRSIDKWAPKHFVWQVRLSTTTGTYWSSVKFESYDWNKAMCYGNELARIFNG